MSYPLRSHLLVFIVTVAACWAAGIFGPTMAYIEKRRADIGDLDAAKKSARELTRLENVGKLLCGPNSRADWSADARAVTCTGNGGLKTIYRLDGEQLQ